MRKKLRNFTEFFDQKSSPAEKVSEEYADHLATFTPEKRKIIRESFDDIMNQSEVSLSLVDKNGKTVEIREIEGSGMAGEPMMFAYIFHDGNLSSREKVKNFLKNSDFKVLSDYLKNISDSNQASAISFVH